MSTIRSTTITFDLEKARCATCGRKIYRFKAEQWNHNIETSRFSEYHRPTPTKETR